MKESLRQQRDPLEPAELATPCLWDRDYELPKTKSSDRRNSLLLTVVDGLLLKRSEGRRQSGLNSRTTDPSSGTSPRKETRRPGGPGTPPGSPATSLHFTAVLVSSSRPLNKSTKPRQTQPIPVQSLATQIARGYVSITHRSNAPSSHCDIIPTPVHQPKASVCYSTIAKRRLPHKDFWNIATLSQLRCVGQKPVYATTRSQKDGYLTNMLRSGESAEQPISPPLCLSAIRQCTFIHPLAPYHRSVSTIYHVFGSPEP